MQSGIGKELCEKYNIDPNIIDSLVLIKNDKIFIKSDAILEISNDLLIGWRLFRIGIILPKIIRDYLYDFIAKHRYKIFGKKDKCPIPSKKVQERFLE